MSKCGKCFFCRITKERVGVDSLYTYDCYSKLNGDSFIVPEEMREKGCENFGGLEKANELFSNQEKYNWRSFDQDKRTAHYKTTKTIREKGADMYLTIFTWSEYKHFDNVPIYAFWHEKAFSEAGFCTHL